MAMLDIFNDSAFSSVELSEGIQNTPNNYGRVGALGLFVPKPVRTTSVSIEINNGVLSLIESSPRGSGGQQNKRAKRTLKSFNIPHFSLEDTVMADDVQNIRPFGNTSELEAAVDFINERMSEMSGKHDITEEWLLATALRGTVLDADGSVLLDLFADFGVTQEVKFFDFTNDAADPRKTCLDVKRHIEQNLKGDTMTSVHALCSSDYFDGLISHPVVKEAYAYQQGLSAQRDDLRKGFTYQDITFEEYVGTATDADGADHPFIPAGDARFFPKGTNSTFREYLAPADMMPFVNTPGQSRYASLEMLKHGKGVEIQTQMNILPICMRPAVLVRGSKAAS
ncbi:MAG: major capsid protein [Parvibaculum sp.]|nr:major capsid protein [Parvibaculum sp.]